jgi:hypothetical protein
MPRPLRARTRVRNTTRAGGHRVARGSFRLLGLGPDEIARHWDAVRHGDHRDMPGAIRASTGLSTSIHDIGRLVSAVAEIASGRPAPLAYHQDPRTGDFHFEDGSTAPPGATVPLAPPAPEADR